MRCLIRGLLSSSPFFKLLGLEGIFDIFGRFACSSLLELVQSLEVVPDVDFPALSKGNHELVIIHVLGCNLVDGQLIELVHLLLTVCKQGTASSESVASIVAPGAVVQFVPLQVIHFHHSLENTFEREHFHAKDVFLLALWGALHSVAFLGVRTSGLLTSAAHLLQPHRRQVQDVLHRSGIQNLDRRFQKEVQL